ncbi:MAG: protein-glutamate O-methyltransferase CheR [Deltaproteobacteria bacterium]|nr:protein-glutamate O-methyltransferase CheR [Deltaproteobacteria bacterium]MBM4348027.1 protein-glutamate O-methyltransferase CheR [Deltaproteobacteria bacterium]
MHFDQFLREVTFLFGLQYRPFKRRGIKRKVERRHAQLGLLDFETYLTRIKSDPAEQVYLSTLLTVTISRFFRDKEIFDTLETSILPATLRNREKSDLNIWSIGCASGEEPYSLSLLWKEKYEKDFPRTRLSILATDIDEGMIERAKKGRYKKSSLREVPDSIIKRYFRIENQFYVVEQTIRESVEFRKQNILEEEPISGMDIVFCRNLAFTYFSKESQIKVLRKIAASLNGKGYLVIGKDESLPLVYPTLFIPFSQSEKIYQKFIP